MNSDLLTLIAVWIGYVAILALAVCVIGSGYLCAYEIIKAVGSRIFFPRWIWHVVTTIAVIKSSKRANKEMIVLYLFNVLADHEASNPDLRGLLDHYAKQRIDRKRKEGGAR